MSKKAYTLYGVILVLILARIFAMVTIPLTDTTEARYAHTAYLMAVTNDWITPYYDVAVPFWGKPPFSFWMQAISYKIFGIHDYSARVPALVFTFLIMILIYKYLKTFYSKTAATWGMIVYLSFLLVYTLSGSILTDPYLTFATALSMVSFIMVVKNQSSYWKYLFFVGLAIGMLSKGPLAVVIVGGGITFWMIFDLKNRFNELKKFPWKTGILLTIIISIPWYIIAEIKTPGFLNYFIIGEHFKRFVDSGWSGDLYGTSHKRPHGMIWLMLIEAAFPWILIVFYALFKNTSSKTNIVNSLQIFKNNSEITYFIMWSIFTICFFTMAGNVLWTYVLPALPSLAILIAIYLEKIDFKIILKKYNLIFVSALFVPVLFILANFYLILVPNKLPTEKELINYYSSIPIPNKELYYIGDRPFSAQYYSKDKAILVIVKSMKVKSYSNSIEFNQFKNSLENSGKKNFIVIPKDIIDMIKSELNIPLKSIYENKRFILFEI